MAEPWRMLLQVVLHSICCVTQPAADGSSSGVNAVRQMVQRLAHAMGQQVLYVVLQVVQVV
jgi:hypothetical protein